VNWFLNLQNSNCRRTLLVLLVDSCKARGGRAHPPNPSAPPPVLALQFNSRANIGYMNVFSDNYLGKTQTCIPTVLLDQQRSDK